MSNFDKSERLASDNEEAPENEGELTQDDLNNVSGGAARQRNADPNDARNERLQQRNDPNDRAATDPA